MIKPFRLKKNTSKISKPPLKHIETSKYKSKDSPSSLIIYDPKIKSLVNYTRGVGRKGSKDYIPSSMEVIYDLFKSFGGEGKINKSSLKFRQNIINSEKEYSYIDPKRRFKVEPLKLSLSYLSRNTVTSYKLTINKNGRNKSLYIKVALDNYSYRNAAQEMILLKYLEQNGISIIKPRFAFSKTHLKKGIHFIVYDFTSLKNVTQGYLEKLISEKEFLQIKNNLMDVTANFMLKDSIQILDITPKNCFYKRLSNGEIKLYLIDVYSADFKMLNSEYLDVNLKNPKEILDFAKKKGIVK